MDATPGARAAPAMTAGSVTRVRIGEPAHEGFAMGSTGDQPAAGKLTYAGLFTITLATLMYEILLTRIFSVTMWYHYAFVAISVAMFGMTVGALLVYLHPGYFTQERAQHHLALSSLLFSLSIVASFLTHLAIPFVTDASVVGIYSIGLTYLVVSVPFVFSGVCVCLALTKFPRQVSRLYAADLAGAAAGCVLLILTLEVTDGPTAVIVVACIAAAGSALFAAQAGFGRALRAALAATLLLGCFAVGHTLLVRAQFPLLRLIWVKQRYEGRALYEKWNSFSRIRVWGDPTRPGSPFGWGLSRAYPSHRKVRQLFLNIDATAGTVLTAFDGDVSAVEHLKYDVTNVVHYLRPDAKVLVVGSGGGRDILSALAFDQRSVLGVEMNRDIIAAVNRRFGDFTGHLDRRPGVRFANDEARSYIARQTDRFDIIQVSLIDTWAATAAGAFVLAENSLYTTEAWKLFLSRLTPRGVLTFSRWYFADRPGEVYRLVSLASASLLSLGVKKPRGHILVVRYLPRQEGGGDQPDGIGTILLSPSPFSHEDLDAVDKLARAMGFEVVLSPRLALDSTFATIASGEDPAAVTSRFPLDISPPTDDRPFFFHMLRLRDMLDRKLASQGIVTFNMKAVTVLGILLAVVVGLTVACVIIPLIRTTEKAALKGAAPLLLFFAGIGLGFMFIEISQMQRLIVFLGHPTYGLSVVLFALLLSSGLGSYSTQSIGSGGMRRAATARLLLLLCGLVAFGVLTPHIIQAFQASSTPLRILLSLGILFPPGLLMGMPFPLGMKIASAGSGHITPGRWGVNGASSVCASVLAVAVALTAGISASFWVGFACYAVALLAFALARTQRRNLDAPSSPDRYRETAAGRAGGQASPASP